MRLWYRLFAYFLLGVLLGGAAVAAFAAVPLTWKGLGVVKRADGYHYQGTVPAQTGDYTVLSTAGVPKINANASANWFVGTGALVQNGGVVFNAAVPIAATAAAAAVVAVRANPAGLITSAVASYLLSKGIEYVGSVAMTNAPPGTLAQYYSTQICPVAPGYNLCTLVPQVGTNCDGGDGNMWLTQTYSASSPGAGWSKMGTCGGGQQASIWLKAKSSMVPCGAGYTLVNGVCVSGSKVPAVESDWDAARTGYWPDDAILDLVRLGVPLPTDKPVFTPESKDVPVSDPYVDPTNGKRYRDVARVTPSPSSPDSADVQMVKQEVDESGNPAVVGGQPVAPEKESDWCKLHPEASGCQPLDDVPDVAIPDITNTFSVNPVAGFGADNAACPAVEHLFTRGGQSVDWSWGQVCTFANGIRPLVIAFAWIAAIAMVVAVGRRN